MDLRCWNWGRLTVWSLLFGKESKLYSQTMMIDVVFERRFKPPSTLLVWKPSLHKNLEFLQSQAIPGFLPSFPIRIGHVVPKFWADIQTNRCTAYISLNLLSKIQNFKFSRSMPRPITVAPLVMRLYWMKTTRVQLFADFRTSNHSLLLEKEVFFRGLLFCYIYFIVYNYTWTMHIVP